MEPLNGSEPGSIEETETGGIGFGDIAIVLILIAVGGYFLLRKKKKSGFDADLISTYSTVETRMTRSMSITESGFIGKLKAAGANVLVFYGSQTGTAEEFAGRLAKESVRYGMKGKAIDPEECDMEKMSLLPVMIENTLVLFCMATYGEGDPTDNAKEFFECLENLSGGFENVRYAVFGLGNKTYENYNTAGKYVDKRMSELGATRVHEIGLGDDDGNIEEDFVTWKEKMWSSACEQLGLEAAEELTNQRQYVLTVHEPGELTPDEIFMGEKSKLKVMESGKLVQTPPFDIKNPFAAKMKVKRELYKCDRSCMHIEFDISGSDMTYQTGDHIGIYCKTENSLVDKVGQHLGVDLNTVITMTNVDTDTKKVNPFPCPTSYRTALQYYVDLNQTPNTYILKEMIAYASDEKDKQILQKMSSYSDEGKALYSEWIVKSCRNIVHVLEDLPSLKPPIDHLLELLPRLQPRFYSIASSPKEHPESVHITAVLIEYDTTTNRKVQGVCTSYLKTKQTYGNDNFAVSMVLCFVRKSTFRLPPKSETPIVMLGPGTGLAPFRGFLQERDWCRKQGRELGKTVLYYGCRKKAEDYLYEDELKEYTANGTISKLHVAFSRDQAEKVYVTHLLRQNKQEIWDIIGNQGGHLYICGDARNMARSVRELFLEVIQEEGQKTKEEAEAFFKKMENTKKYQADVWS